MPVWVFVPAFSSGDSSIKLCDVARGVRGTERASSQPQMFLNGRFTRRQRDSQGQYRVPRGRKDVAFHDSDHARGPRCRLPGRLKAGASCALFKTDARTSTPRFRQTNTVRLPFACGHVDPGLRRMRRPRSIPRGERRIRAVPRGKLRRHARVTRLLRRAGRGGRRSSCGLRRAGWPRHDARADQAASDSARTVPMMAATWLCYARQSA